MFTVSMLGTDRSVWITDPAAIKELYLRDRENLLSPGTATALGPMFGLRSVFFADRVAHRRKRGLLMPRFHGDQITAWRTRMIEAAEREVDSWPNGTEFSLAPRMAAVTEEIIFEVIFGLRDGGRQRQLRTALSEMVEASLLTAGVLLGFFPPSSRLRRAPLTPWGRLQRKIDRTRALLDDEIQRRRADPDLAHREDVFSLLLQARDDTPGRRWTMRNFATS